MRLFLFLIRLGSGLSLVMKIGNTQILSRTVSAGNNTIGFSVAELDSIYKLYGRGNSLTATFVLSGGGYTNSRNCTITLKGNQRTVWDKIAGNWRRGRVWIKVNGVWRLGVVWRNVNGSWKRGI